MAGNLIYGVVRGITFAVFAGAAGAQTLTDPLRPPIEFMPAAGAAAALPTAQVVILGAGRRLVTLNGQTVREGAQLGDARVESLTDSEVVLRIDSRTRDRIPLYPGIAKTPSAPAPAQGAGKTEAKK